MIEPIHVVFAGGVLGFVITVILVSLFKLRLIFIYAYVNARLAAMDVRLFSHAKIKDIANQKSARGVSEVLMNTDYKTIAEEDIDSGNCEMIFNQYLVDHIGEVRGFSPKITAPLLNFYLREWEIKNILSMLHIVKNGIPVDKDDAGNFFVDVRGFTHHKMMEIALSDDEDEALDMLKDTEYYSVIDEYLARGENSKMPDVMFDRYNIMKLYDDAEIDVMRGGVFDRVFGRKGVAKEGSMNRTDSDVIRNYACMRADMLNMVIAMRVVLSGGSGEVFDEQSIPIGLFMTSEKRDAMRSIGKIDDLEGVVFQTPYEEAFRNGLNEFKKSGKIDGIVERFDVYLRDHVKAMARDYPFSIAVLLKYMALKREEVLVVRGVVKGLCSGNVKFDVDEDFRIVGDDN